MTIVGIEAVHKMNEPLMNKKNYFKALDKIVVDTVAEIKRNAPVGKTGDLEKNIFIGEQGNKRIIFVAMPYAKYMEYGTQYFPVGTINAPRARTSTSGKPCYHPFIRPSIWRMMKKAKKEGIFFTALFKK